MAHEKAGLSIGLCMVVFYPLTRLLGRRRFSDALGVPVDLSVFRRRPRDGEQAS